MDQRMQQVTEQIRRLAAKYFQVHTPDTPMVTITRADVSNDLKHATVYITVLPEEKEDEALASARAKLTGFGEYLGNNLETKNTPKVTLDIDAGEKKRQRIDEIANNT
jgi:ribosome-binding factor A